MRMIALTAALGAGLLGLAACADGGGNEAAAEANDTLDANGTASDAATGGTDSPAAPAADGDLDVDVNLKVPEPRLEGVTVGPDGATVNVGDDPAVSVTANRN